MNMIKLLCVPLTVLALSTGAAMADGKGHRDKPWKKPKVHHSTQFCPPGWRRNPLPVSRPVRPRRCTMIIDDDDHEDRVIYYRVGDVVRDDCLVVPYYGISVAARRHLLPL